MITACFHGVHKTTAHGLTQWDYGQFMVIEAVDLIIPDGADVQYYQRDLMSTEPIHNGVVKIPDKMLQFSADIMAYVYARGETCGETILTIRLPVVSRPRPEDYILPEYEEYRRLIPDGGEEGQTLRKQSEKSYSIVWGDTADSINLTDGVLQLMSGSKPIGQRVRLPAGSGREIELKNDGAAIVWRYTDSNEWSQLVALEELKGQPGDTPDFEVRDGHLIVIYPD